MLANKVDLIFLNRNLSFPKTTHEIGNAKNNAILRMPLTNISGPSISALSTILPSTTQDIMLSTQARTAKTIVCL